MNNIDNIQTKEDFIKFLGSLEQACRKNDWENNTLLAYLNSMKDWTEDMDGFFANMSDDYILRKIKNNSIDWNVFAHILYAATMYE